MISIIIPTHNRADALNDTLERLFSLSAEASFDVVVVDNDSSDGTQAVIERWQKIRPELKSVRESRRAACAARNTGARNATGEILLFLDDDVRVEPGSLYRIRQIFNTYPNCGMVAAQVLPRFESEPPAWARACQDSYNGWSLYHPGNRPHLAKGFQEDDYAMGAMHALTREAFDRAGGYPPDIVIIGTGPSAYRLDIGAGDTGLSHLVKKLGYQIFYDPSVCGHHLVAASRFTPQFWRARMVSEAHYHAVSKRVFWQMRPAQLLLDRKRVQMEFFKAVRALEARLQEPPPEGGIYPEEMWVHYYHAYLCLDRILREFPSFCLYLDRLSRDGSPAGSDPEQTFPPPYRAFVARFFRSPLQPLKSAQELGAYLAAMDLPLREECGETEALLSLLHGEGGEPLGTIREQLLGVRGGGAQLLLGAISRQGLSSGACSWLMALLAEAGAGAKVAEFLQAARGQLQIEQEMSAIARQAGVPL